MKSCWTFLKETCPDRTYVRWCCSILVWEKAVEKASRLRRACRRSTKCMRKDISPLSRTVCAPCCWQTVPRVTLHLLASKACYMSMCDTIVVNLSKMLNVAAPPSSAIQALLMLHGPAAKNHPKLFGCQAQRCNVVCQNVAMALRE